MGSVHLCGGHSSARRDPPAPRRGSEAKGSGEAKVGDHAWVAEAGDGRDPFALDGQDEQADLACAIGACSSLR